jgi:CheY-like chemotaxis protein
LERGNLFIRGGGVVSAVPINILLVEDDTADVLITREAFVEHKVRNRLTVLRDGGEALAFLRGDGAGVTDVILLDLDLPTVSGREVLAAVRADPVLRRIPVVVLTNSRVEADILAGQLAGVHSYLLKPVDFDQLVAVVRHVEEFYISVERMAPA